MRILLNEKRDRAPNQTFPLREVNSVEIISLIDNSADFLSTIERKEVQQARKWVKQRRGEEWTKEHFSLPLAEHGLSMWIRVICDGKSHSMLFDSGNSPEGVVTNVQRMGLDLSEIESIILSHGHADHCGGLPKVVRAINKEIPVIVHDDMFKMRGVVNPDGTIRRYPNFPAETQIKPARYVKTKQPYLLADDAILVTGEIPRETDFEKGFLEQRALINGKWQPDPWVWDDRAIIINIRQKGLVVIAGCAHAGILNTTLYAQRITGVSNVLAIMGGFHLAGKDYEKRISRTVEELKRINPTILVPMHCTGWKGCCALTKAMPQAFVWNSVGNLYKF